MKKSMTWMLVLSMLLSMAAIGGWSIPAAVIYRDGDINGDGDITTYDARLLMVYILSGVAMEPAVSAAADLTGEGNVNTSDVRLIMLKALQGTSDVLTAVDMLAPTVDDWNNPVQMAGVAHCAMKETALANGGYTFTNVTERDEGAKGALLNPLSWPFASYAYDAKVLAPSTAVIEFDLTVSSASASMNLFLGGDVPYLDDNANPNYMSLNPFITDNLDASTEDILPGTYSGTISVQDLIDSGAVPDDCRPSGYLWISGIKLFVVGYNDNTVTIRKLKLSAAHLDGVDVDLSTDPLTMVRHSLVDTAETEGLATLTGMELYENGARTTATTMQAASVDTKKIYQTQYSKRIMNYADGYRIDIPFDWTPDYSLSALRSRYTSDDYVLTVSKEEESPYANTTAGWNTYFTEWLNPYIGNESFLANNYIRYLRTPVESTTMLDGYTVLTYDMAIDWQGNIEMPYYSIAVIRKFQTYNSFYLMVLKSNTPTDGMIDRLIRSFKEIGVVGTATNAQGQYNRIAPSSWNAQTLAYYNKLVEQDSTDWGFFSHSMLEITNENYATRQQEIESEYDRITAAIGTEYDIMPTYTHLSYGSNLNPFPLEMAQQYAGGNGFNGKPVLQFTYQYTMTNNQKLDGPTPVFNVLRGDYDAHFRQLARDIKAYGQPILFRLNNEMNTDWTSYCGLVSLLDPDIFVKGWQHLYDIFEEEGVDNCIWIFNPFTPTYPNCSWGDPLCYMPGEEYVQVLGLTDYEMGNGSSVPYFQEMYTEVYNINKDSFIRYPWIISEFACGAGGEKQFDWDTDTWKNTTLGRNRYVQYYWIQNMFSCLNNRASYPFCKNIKGAVWFNCNDYTQIDGTDYIVNYLELDESSTWAFNAFRQGLAQ